MNKKIFITLIFCSISVKAGAEEFLHFHKYEAKYLGWQISKNSFITCNKKTFRIGDGRVEKTAEKCPKDSTPSPLSLTGTVEEVNKDARSFKVSKEGKVYNFFFPEEFAEKGSASFSDLKAGDTIEVFSAAKRPEPTEWNRAKSVKLRNK